MTRRALITLLVAFSLTRALTFTQVFDEAILGASFGDLEKYQQWSQAAVEEGRRPYQDVPIEYPPGVLPFIVLPRMVVGEEGAYSTPFALLMLLLDAATFMVLLLLARRWGSPLGAWVWVVGLPLVGPMIYLRLDLIPAMATVVALERAAAGTWGEAGGWMGFGAVAKVYPGLLLPGLAAIAPKVAPLLFGAGLIAALFVAPTVIGGGGPELWENVAGYHGVRGIHVESTWGFLMLALSKAGLDMSVNYQFGANEALGSLVPVLKGVGTSLSLASVLAWVWVARRLVVRGDVHGAARVSFGCLALLMGFGTVFSPQYMVWLIALAAVVLSERVAYPSWGAAVPLAVVPVAALTQLVYPGTISHVLAPFYQGATEAGSVAGLTVLGLRNAAVIGAGMAMLWVFLGRDGLGRRTPALR